MNKLIIMSGVAGSGKSTWANNYAQNNANTLILSTDEIRQKLFNTQYPDRESEKIIRQTILNKAREAASQGINVIVDSAVVKNKSIMRWYRQLAPYFKVRELVIIDTPLEKCLEQNNQRDRHVPESVIKEMFSFKEPLSQEMRDSFDNIIIINGEKH